MSYFGLQTRNYGRKRRRKEKKRKKERNQARYGCLYGCMTVVWNCRDFGMIFVHELLGYECWGFSGRFN